MRIGLLTIILAFSFLVFNACNDNNDPLNPPDYSDLIKGNWQGTTTVGTDTLSFNMNLDGAENKVTGQSDFQINSDAVKQLTVTGEITYPNVSFAFLGDGSDFTFTGHFQATTSNIIAGTIQNEKYGSIPITFTKSQ